MRYPEGGELFTVLLAGALGRDESPVDAPGELKGAGKTTSRACPPPYWALKASSELLEG